MTPPVLPELPIWRRVRRYAVPQRMIEQCTAAREAGDWRAACAAARIDVTFDLAEVADALGRAAAEGVERDLLALAPDLLRWHLPRVLGGRTSLATRVDFGLSVREDRIVEDDEPETFHSQVVLGVQTPKTVDGSQRLSLAIGLARPRRLDLPPAFWSAAHVGGLRAAYGGGPARLPGLEPDGSARPFASYSDTVDDTDPASRAEAFDRHIAAGEVVAAWGAAGIDLDPAGFEESGERSEYTDGVTAGRIVPFGLAAELSRLYARYGSTEAVAVAARGWRGYLVLRRRDDGTVAASFEESTREIRGLRRMAQAVYTRPADLDLVRHGLLEPSELHPLVREALFPAAPTGPAPDPDRRDPDRRDTDRRDTDRRDTVRVHADRSWTGPPDLRRSVRVRCGGEWHTVVHGDGRLDLVAHTVEEVRREQTLSALGGRVSGCVAVLRAWHGSLDRLPRPLRELRREVLQAVQHGGSVALSGLLDAGLDPLMCDGSGGTLLHHMREVHDPALVRRLVDAGVPLETTNRRRSRTALHVTICDGGSPEMVRALLEAGADLAAKEARGYTAAELAEGKASLYGEEGASHEEVDEEYQAPVIIREIVDDWLAGGHG